MDKHFLPEHSPDILIRRDTFPPDKDHDAPFDVVRVNVPRVVIWHSPDGFNFGYAGSGAADLALNILQAFLPGEEIPCAKGTKCSRAAALLHQPFKEDFLVGTKSDRIRLEDATIKEWIARELPKHREALAVALEETEEDAPKDAAAAALTAAMLPNHPSAAALLYLVNEARRNSKMTELEIVEAFLANFPSIQLPAAEEPKTGSELFDELKSLTLLTGDVLSLLGHRSAKRPPKTDPLRAMVHLKSLDNLLDRIEVKLGMSKAQESKS